MELKLSQDPETARQISELTDHQRPLLVVDVDEVILEFVRPFMRFLAERGYFLRTDSFRLNGNVVLKDSGKAVDDETVEQLIEGLFAEQENWQTAVDGAAEALNSLNQHAAIVLLTAMPHRHREKRRRLLDELRIPYPLLTTESAKGPALSVIRGDPSRPVAFVDDIPHNLASVKECVPDASLFHLMSFRPFKSVMPKLPDGISDSENWAEAKSKIARALGIEGHMRGG